MMKHLRLSAALFVAAVLATTSLSDMPGASAAAPQATSLTGQVVVPASAKGETRAARPVSTKPFGRRLYYGAISINTATWGWGVSYDYRTKANALWHAQHNCQTHNGQYWRYCRKVVWVRNGCAAVAGRWQRGTGRMLAYAWAVAYSKYTAKHRAYRKLRAPKKNITWVCTTRYR